jgi:transposase
VVIETVVSKYCDRLPLYRQAVILEREAGLEIGRATRRSRNRKWV